MVSRSQDKLDVFVTGINGKVYTAAWEPSDGGAGFRGWWHVAGGLAEPGVVLESLVRSGYLMLLGANRDRDRLGFITKPKIT